MLDFPIYAKYIEDRNLGHLTGQHAEMAANFVNQIGSALYDYAIGAGINISPSYANDIAWGGLAQVKGFTLNADGNLVIGGVDTEWFKAAIPDATIRQRINDNIENEEKGNSASKGGESGC
jgi:hypothetical protein